MRVLEIVEEAEQRFQAKDIMAPASRAIDSRARAWAMARCHAEGFGLEEIAEHFSTTPAAVKAVLAIPPAIDVDDDEHDDVVLHKPSRMRPVHGERRACENASDCLGELLRASAPRAPRYASCPPDCGAFQPPAPRPLPRHGERLYERCPPSPELFDVPTSRLPTRTKHARRPGGRRPV